MGQSCSEKCCGSDPDKRRSTTQLETQQARRSLSRNDSLAAEHISRFQTPDGQFGSTEPLDQSQLGSSSEVASSSSAPRAIRVDSLPPNFADPANFAATPSGTVQQFSTPRSVTNRFGGTATQHFSTPRSVGPRFSTPMDEPRFSSTFEEEGCSDSTRAGAAPESTTADSELALRADLAMVNDITRISDSHQILKSSPTALQNDLCQHNRYATCNDLTLAPHLPLPPRPPLKQKLSKYWNKNRPVDFAWCKPLLENICTDSSFACRRLAKGDRMLPGCVVAGACPNTFCTMQAVLLTISPDASEVGFWWIKPEANNEKNLERATLDLHSTGAHRNAADGSKEVYQPLANMFENGTNGFAIRRNEDGVHRFVIDYKGATLWVYLLWQEKWQTNPWSSNKFITGKIVYQKNPKDNRFFSRTYHFKAPDSMVISEVEDVEWGMDPMPDDCVKDL